MKRIHHYQQKNARKKVSLLLFMSLFFLFFQGSFLFALVINDLALVPSGNKVMIGFTTDQPTNVTVVYGTEAMDNTFIESAMKSEHQLTIQPLEENKRYYFKVTACSEHECVSSSLLEAETKELPLTLATKIITPSGFSTPLIEEAFSEQLINNYKVDVSIITKPQAEVYLSLNDQLKRYDRVGLSGNVTFRHVDIVDGATITIKAKYGNVSLEQAIVLHVDANPPTIMLSSLPSLLTSSQVNISGNVSEPATITLYDTDRDVLTFSAEGSFTQQITLQDGKHNLTFFAKDQAGNRYEKTFTIEIDTKDNFLNLEEQPPSSVYVDKVRIKGKTKPFAYVFAFVNNKTGPKDAIPNSLVGLLESFGALVDTNERYQTQADANGTFVLDVRLSHTISQRERINQENVVGELSSYDALSMQEWSNELFFVSIDRFNRTATAGPYLVTIKQCDEGGDWNFVIDHMSPSVVNPGLLEQGIASIGINFHLEWQGPGDEPNDVTLTVRPWKRSGDIGDANKDNTLIQKVGKFFTNDLYYGTITLDLAPYGDRDTIRNIDTLHFLLEAEIHYSYTTIDGNPRTRTQRKCLPVQAKVDKGIYLDEKIPKKFLEKTTKALDKAQEFIDEARDKISGVQKILFYASLGSKVAEVFANVQARMACGNFLSGFTLNPPDVPLEDCASSEKGDEASCIQCWNALQSYERLKEVTTWIQDRFYCPSVPSFQEFAEEVKKHPPKYAIIKNEQAQRNNDVLTLPRDQAKEICNNVNYNNAQDTRNELCKQYYLDTYQSACPLYRNLYESSFNRSQESFFDKFVESMNFCSLAKQFKKKGQVIELNDKCEKEINGDLVQQNLPCYVIVEEYPNGSTQLYWGEAGYTITDLSEDDENTKQWDKCYKNKQQQISFKQGDKTQTESCQDVYLSLASNRKSYIRKTPEVLTDKEIEANNLRHLKRKAPPIIVDPRSGILRSLQCSCVSGTAAYLNMYSGAIDAINKCFKSILLTGKASGALCQSVLSTYVCDLIYDTISCAGKALLVSASNNQPPTAQERAGVKEFFKQLAGATQEVTDSISNRYGTTDMYRAMFSERTLLHTACLSAFYGDWDVNVESMLNSATQTIAVDSQALVYPRTRRFLSANPTNGLARHAYEIGYGIIAGSNINYQLRLRCSNDQSCDPNEGFENGQCDCYGKGTPQYRPVPGGSGSLRQGDFKQDSLVFVDESPYRYDTVELVLNYQSDSVIGTDRKQVIKEYPIKQVGGELPATCKFDVLAGQFMCDIVTNLDRLLIFPQESPIRPMKKVYQLGELITFTGSFIKKNPPDQVVPIKLVAVAVLPTGEPKKQEWVISQEGTVDVASYSTSGIQGTGIPGFKVAQDWFVGGDSARYVYSNRFLGATDIPQNAFKAEVVPPIKDEIFITYKEAKDFSQVPNCKNDANFKTYNGPFIKIANPTQKLSFIADAVSCVDDYNNLYLKTSKGTPLNGLQIEVTDIASGEKGKIRLYGIPGFIALDKDPASSDKIEVKPQTSTTIPVKIFLRFYRLDSESGYYDDKNLIKTLTFTVDIENKPTSAQSCQSYQSYNFARQKIIDKLKGTGRQTAAGCFCGDELCYDYCVPIKKKENNGQLTTSYQCKQLPQCFIGKDKRNTEPCFCNDQVCRNPDQFCYDSDNNDIPECHAS